MKPKVFFVGLLLIGLTVGCNNDDDIDAPIANFDIDNNNCLVPCSIGFTSSTIGEGVTLQWDFGDGGSALGGEQVSHLYQQNGTYTVTLNATNSAGFNQIKKQVEIRY